MRAAVTTQQPTLDAPIDERFGRCASILIVETADMSWQALENPYVDQPNAAGRRLAALLARRHVEMLLAGTIGPNAQEVLENAGIAIAETDAATAREAIETLITKPPPTKQRLAPAITPLQGHTGRRHRVGRGNRTGSGPKRWGGTPRSMQAPTARALVGIAAVVVGLDREPHARHRSRK
jgi:predicted Fe-Mo cluster-binding NifX family protein